MKKLFPFFVSADSALFFLKNYNIKWVVFKENSG